MGGGWTVVGGVVVVFPALRASGFGLRAARAQASDRGKAYGGSSWTVLRTVSLPSALPFILAGLKLGIGRGLFGGVVAELFGSRAGLGRLISKSADAFNMPALFDGVIVLAVAGIAMTAGLGWLGKRSVPRT